MLDILKEADLRIGFTECFKSAATREVLERTTLQKRLLLCLYGLGTNTGLLLRQQWHPGCQLHRLTLYQATFYSKRPVASSHQPSGERHVQSQNAAHLGRRNNRLRGTIPKSLVLGIRI